MLPAAKTRPMIRPGQQARRTRRCRRLASALAGLAVMAFPLAGWSQRSPIDGAHDGSGLRLARQESSPATSIQQPSSGDILKSLLERTPFLGPDERFPVSPLDDRTADGLRIPLGGSQPDRRIQIEHDQGFVTLTARNAPLRQLLEDLSEAGSFNYVMTGAAEISVSITLNRVPIERALSSVLIPSGYTWTVREGVVFISPLTTESNLPAAMQGRVLRVFELDFARALDIDGVIQGMLSPAGNSYALESAADDNRRTREALVVEDLPEVLQRVAQYVRQVDIPPRQVMIQAHVLQIDLDDENRHGVNFDHLMSIANRSVNIGVVGFANPNVTQAFTAQITSGQTDAFIEMLKTTTDAKTLAAPRVMVVNGQDARIQIGEQLGFRVLSTTETSTLESVEFLDVGVVLNVTPRVSRDGRVLMQVKPEVSSGAVNPDTGLPEEETSEVETNVLLRDGEGMVVGGLIQETNSNVQAKTHLLGDIFLIGNLFRRRELAKRRSEIIFVLVPRIVPNDLPPEYEELPSVARATTPLVYGPLIEYPRPFESRLPDASSNPVYRLPAVGPIPQPQYYQPAPVEPQLFGDALPQFVMDPAKIGTIDGPVDYQLDQLAPRFDGLLPDREAPVTAPPDDVHNPASSTVPSSTAPSSTVPVVRPSQLNGIVSPFSQDSRRRR